MVRPSRVMLAIVAAFCALVYFTSAARFFFRSDSLSASVTDLRTGGPIEGAVVVVVWKLRQPLMHGTDHQTLHVAHATTDSNGRFHIEAWGPKYAGVFWTMPAFSPEAYILKSGYTVGSASNYSRWPGGFRCADSKLAKLTRAGVPLHAHHTIVVSWNQCAIPLDTTIESPGDYASWLDRLDDFLCGNDLQYCTATVAKYISEERQRLSQERQRLLDLNFKPDLSEGVR